MGERVQHIFDIVRQKEKDTLVLQQVYNTMLEENVTHEDVLELRNQ